MSTGVNVTRGGAKVAGRKVTKFGAGEKAAAMQVVAQLYLGFGKALALGSGRDLQAMLVEGDGVVVGHYAGVFEAEVVGRISLFWQGT